MRGGSAIRGEARTRVRHYHAPGCHLPIPHTCLPSFPLTSPVPPTRHLHISPVYLSFPLISPLPFLFLSFPLHAVMHSFHSSALPTFLHSSSSSLPSSPSLPPFLPHTKAWHPYHIRSRHPLPSFSPPPFLRTKARHCYHLVVMEMVVMIVVLAMVIVVVKMVDVVIGVLLTHLVRDSPFLSLPLPPSLTLSFMCIRGPGTMNFCPQLTFDVWFYCYSCASPPWLILYFLQILFTCFILMLPNNH